MARGRGGPSAGGARAWPRWGAALGLFGVLGFLVVYPLGILVAGSFIRGNPVLGDLQWGKLTLANYREVFGTGEFLRALWNTAVAVLGGALGALVIGFAFAWVVARTDAPGRRFVETGALLPLFVPPLVGALAWSILGSPRNGLLNVAAREWGLPLAVDFYSLPGVVFVFAVYYAPYIYLFLAAALANMDPALEEASEVAGGTLAQTFRYVTLPLVRHAAASGVLLAAVVMLGIYSIPAVLGTPGNIPFLTTYIYQLVTWTPPYYDKAATVAMFLIVLTALGLAGQRALMRSRSVATITGKAFRPKRIRLRRWRWPVLFLCLGYVAAAVALPYAALAVAAFRKFMFVPTLAALLDVRPLTLDHFVNLFGNPLTLRSIVNAVGVGLVTAAIGGSLSLALAYVIHRSNVPGRRLMDYLSVLPAAIPGVVVGVAYLWAWITLPIGLYGTIWILALAYVARFLPDTLKALSGTLIQVHRDLEEASFVCGGTLGRTLRAVTLPLIRSGLFASMALLFVLSIRELGSSIFLYSNRSITMSVLLLNLWEGGVIGITAAFSLVQSLLLLLIILGLRWVVGATPGLGLTD